MEENSLLRNQLATKKDDEADRPPLPMNDSLQLGPKETLPTLDPTISVGGAKVVPLLATAPFIATSLMTPLVTYSILTLLLIAIIWIVVGKKIWHILRKQREKFINKEHWPDIYYLNS